MALHGDIKVNGTKIGYWEAVRTDQIRYPENPAYRCKFVNGDKEYNFSLTHRYADGPAVLASKVLALGALHVQTEENDG